MRDVIRFIRNVHDHDDVHAAFGPWQVPLGPRGPFGLPGGPFGGHGHGPFGGHGHGPFPRGRARRGDVRAAILALLAERPMHGYEMIQELSGRTGGMWRPSPGSVYPTLQMLEDEGLISSHEADGKRLFSLTDTGREEAGHQSHGEAPWEHVTAGVDQATLRLRDAVLQADAAVMQVMHAGTEEQKAKALEVLTETRRRLYTILAEDEGTEGTSQP
jgi:DNA-binding PadR family transcriptional regulator